ncbi:hypothetical protein N0B31_12940 [Salinirubellus salinus]|uniref:Uncharacterized protein n=1 Tax=Salinirubellus salinus TaxID=1364945 RepID=A0A9E7QZT4_9EURY|nr:hypothetical protein [Salinirubellus salinus]UWM53054.1 hypothetical protein N0B31_12940 [Salinirubellus salinus]
MSKRDHRVERSLEEGRRTLSLMVSHSESLSNDCVDAIKTTLLLGTLLVGASRLPAYAGGGNAMVASLVLLTAGLGVGVYGYLSISWWLGSDGQDVRDIRDGQFSDEEVVDMYATKLEDTGRRNNRIRKLVAVSWILILIAIVTFLSLSGLVV